MDMEMKMPKEPPPPSQQQQQQQQPTEWAASAPLEACEPHAPGSPSHSTTSAATTSSEVSAHMLEEDASIAEAMQIEILAAEATEMRSSISSDEQSVASRVDEMWEARRQRQAAERRAEQKLLDAVCAASLLEHNERNRVQDEYEIELVQRAMVRDQERELLRIRREQSERKKREALQRVIDAKTRAAELSQQARAATEAYQQRVTDRVEKEAALESEALQTTRAQALAALQHQREEAVRRREEAEQKACNAHAQAEQLRRQAFAAAQLVRQTSRLQIESELSQEEVARTRARDEKLRALEASTLSARALKMAAEDKARAALRRAQLLTAKADQARRNVAASSEARRPSAA